MSLESYGTQVLGGRRLENVGMHAHISSDGEERRNKIIYIFALVFLIIACTGSPLSLYIYSPILHIKYTEEKSPDFILSEIIFYILCNIVSMSVLIPNLFRCKIN